MTRPWDEWADRIEFDHPSDRYNTREEVDDHLARGCPLCTERRTQDRAASRRYRGESRWQNRPRPVRATKRWFWRTLYDVLGGRP